ncbi:dual specificity protein phosphatase family protein [Candidatus Uhrbacteria bacterium]|nr:dual specificity protein phosphatase family protein [Candidatus Uhrbacteria bacterium]
MKKEHLSFDYDQITPYVFIGTNECCQTHFNKQLLGKEIKANISLEFERIDAPYGVKYFLWLPVRDHSAPRETQLMVGANVLADLVEAKVKTFVHCQNGHGRAPTLVAAYFVLKGMDLDEAIEFVETKRRAAHVEPSQRRALKQFEKTIKKQRHKH